MYIVVVGHLIYVHFDVILLVMALLTTIVHQKNTLELAVYELLVHGITHTRKLWGVYLHPLD